MTDPHDALAPEHSAEHLLSAVMRRLYGSPRNLEMHLGAKKCKCDYRVPRPLDSGDLAQIESAVNAEIVADHPILVTTLSRAEAERRLDLWKVPAEATMIRIVRIGGIDETACSGDHVERTGKIGRFVIKSADPRSPDVIRIRWTLERRRTN